MRRRLAKLTAADRQLAADMVAGIEQRDIAYHLDQRRRQLQAADRRAERLQADLDQLDHTRALIAQVIARLLDRSRPPDT